MAYNNGYSFNSWGDGFSRAPRSNRGYSGRRGYGNRGNGRPAKKHSGARYIDSTKNGNPVITAWNYSRKAGLLSILIAPYKGSRIVQSKSGREWAVWMCSIEGKGVRDHFPVLVEMRTKRAIIQNGYGWVVNPSAPNGGYCGTFTKK